MRNTTTVELGCCYGECIAVPSEGIILHEVEAGEWICEVTDAAVFAATWGTTAQQAARAYAQSVDEHRRELAVEYRAEMACDD